MNDTERNNQSETACIVRGTPSLDEIMKENSTPEDYQAWKAKQEAEETNEKRRLDETIRAEKEAAKAKAEAHRTMQETMIRNFEKKWRSKRFNEMNCGTFLVARQTHFKMQRLAYLQETELFTAKRMTAITDKITSNEGAAQLHVYINLTNWIKTYNENARFNYKIFAGAVMFFNETACHVAREARLKRYLLPEAKIACSEVYKTGLDFFADGNGVNYKLLFDEYTTRLEESLRYITSYDTLIDMIAQEIRIPELDVWKISSSFGSMAVMLEDGIRNYNHHLDLIRSNYLNKPEYQTPYYQNLISTYLRPIETEAPAIPQANLTEAGNLIRGLKAFSPNIDQTYIMTCMTRT